ncbi:MAG: helix-turn-helix domain-containing protein, partial [Roseobacter sp.]|nr:helix-turn-helix domain-containing protein [Roseobacter sp.]
MYLAHTEAGFPIRALARASGCHASTILRQIRRIESRRDDPLVDAALRNLGRAHFRPCSPIAIQNDKEDGAMSFQDKIGKPGHDAQNSLIEGPMFEAEAARVLRRLCETGAVLAVAAAMEKAVIVRDGAGGMATRTGVVDRTFAEALALKDWISPKQNGKITRYSITAAGRSALENMLGTLGHAEQAGFAESQTVFDATAAPVEAPPVDDRDAPRPRRMRYNLA